MSVPKFDEVLIPKRILSTTSLTSPDVTGKKTNQLITQTNIFKKVVFKEETSQIAKHSTL